MSTAKPVLRLHGAFEVENFGDILLARIFADWVRELGWEPVIVDAPTYVTRELGLTSGISAEEAKGLLLIGGGYFGEPNRSLPSRWRWGFKLLRRHLSVLDWSIGRDVPAAVVGAGFGPISNLPARWRTRSLLQRTTSTVLRDQESQAWAVKYGVRVDAVSADAALTLADQPLVPAAKAQIDRLKAIAGGRPIVVVQLDHPDGTDADWTLLHATLADKLKGQDYLVVGVADQRGTTVAEVQKQSVLPFLERVGQSQFEPYESIDQMIGVLAAADLIITSKLHLGIVGTALGRSVLSVPNHQKTERFYKQIGRSDICVPKKSWTTGTISVAFDRAVAAMGSVPPIPAGVLDASRANKNAVQRFVSGLAANKRLERNVATAG